MTLRVASYPVAMLAVLFSLSAAAASRTSTPPNVLIDLSNFKLTLPVDSKGKASGKAATIENQRLNGSPGYTSSYFYSDTDGAMVFYSPSNGADTSPDSGSDHTRSELRELYRVSGPTEWTNAIGGTMTASCHVDKVAKKSGKAIIGQIHGLDSMMMLLYYNAAKKTVEAKFHAKPGSSSVTIYVVASDVKLGDRIDYQIQWIGSTASVTVNRNTINRVTSSSWNKVPVYFKAGAYSSAPTTGNASGDATKVAFSSLQLQH
ncbi:polysaccharide lyase family 7 protein [uncultured Nevskia sp.]|uniref:polysaccharide lyase family 7 protein n=1 Tax=uncultured Nevskia sp. TaxID=228950 RepID=UPI0025FE1A90|nr:polysaccharide lyase family 7 protein [uncultured Nevskia sp.]